MKFTPKTEQQLAEENLLTPGIYPFDVLEAHPKVSKAAQAAGQTEPNMIELKLKVYEDADRGVFVTDYLMEAMAFKLRHFCEEVGLLDQYNKGTLTADMCAGRSGHAKIGPSKPNGDFKPKDEVKDYGRPKTTQKQTAKVSAAAQSGDPDWLA
jgi:hypothetical protein